MSLTQYIIKRTLLFFPTLFGIILVTFIILQFVPGGPIEQAISQMRHGNSSGEVASGGTSVQQQKGKLEQEHIDSLKRLYGFDKPLHERFLNWLYRLFTFQFGESYYHNKDVIDLVKDRLPVSISLGVASFFLTYLVCIPLGIAKAVKDGSTFDFLTSSVILIGYSIPGFVLGVFLLVLFGGGSFWDIFPIRGLHSDNWQSLSAFGKLIDYLHHLTLPLICLTIGNFAVLTNLTKNTVIDNIKQQYVLTARAKGVSEGIILWKHVFRNSMIPLVTGFAGSFLTMFFAGALLIERLFSLDGLGLLSYEAVMQRDYPIVMANLFFFSLLFVVGNLLSDIMYVLVDPRIDFD